LLCVFSKCLLFRREGRKERRERAGGKEGGRKREIERWERKKMEEKEKK
jgi:hypothetical protein